MTPLLAPIALLLVYALLTRWLSGIDGARARERDRRTERTFEASSLELTKAPPLWTVDGGPAGGRVTVTRVLSQPLPGVGARMTVSDAGGCNRSYGVRCENGDDIGALGVTTAALQGAAILVSLGGLVSLRRLGS